MFTSISLFVVSANTVLVLTAILGPLDFNNTTGIVYVSCTFTILGLVILINYTDYTTRRRSSNLRRGSSVELEEGRTAHTLARLVSRLNPTPVSSDEEERDSDTRSRAENSSGLASIQSTCRPLLIHPSQSPPPPPPPPSSGISISPQEDSGEYAEPLDSSRICPPPLNGLFTHHNILDFVQSSDRCRAVLHRLNHAPLTAVWSANPVYGACRIVHCEQDSEDSGVCAVPSSPPPPYSPPVPPRAPLVIPPLVSPYAVADLY